MGNARENSKNNNEGEEKMMNIIGTVLFGFGTGLETKVLYDKIVEEKPIDDKHKRMIALGLVFMLIGDVLRRIKTEEGGQEVW